MGGMQKGGEATGQRGSMGEGHMKVGWSYSHVYARANNGTTVARKNQVSGLGLRCPWKQLPIVCFWKEDEMGLE